MAALRIEQIIARGVDILKKVSIVTGRRAKVRAGALYVYGPGGCGLSSNGYHGIARTGQSRTIRGPSDHDITVTIGSSAKGEPECVDQLTGENVILRNSEKLVPAVFEGSVLRVVRIVRC